MSESFKKKKKEQMPPMSKQSFASRSRRQLLKRGHSEENIDLNKRDFLKKGLLVVVGGTVLGLLSKIPLVKAFGVVSKAEFKDYSETVNALGDLGGGTDDIDLSLGNVVTATVSTSTETFTFSNPPASGKAGSFTLILTNGGSQTVNWPASVDWVGGTAPTLTSAGVDVITFVTTDGGTTWLGFVAGLDIK